MNNARHVDNLERMVAFCENNSDCRCAVLLNYFGECGKICHDFQTMCDICKTKMVKATESDFQIGGKRKRFVIKGEKKAILVLSYETERYPDNGKLNSLAQETGLPVASVVGWFKNQRRTKK